MFDVDENRDRGIRSADTIDLVKGTRFCLKEDRDKTGTIMGTITKVNGKKFRVKLDGKNAIKRYNANKIESYEYIGGCYTKTYKILEILRRDLESEAVCIDPTALTEVFYPIGKSDADAKWQKIDNAIRQNTVRRGINYVVKVIGIEDIEQKFPEIRRKPTSKLTMLFLDALKKGNPGTQLGASGGDAQVRRKKTSTVLLLDAKENRKGTNVFRPP